jgi:hypothetical protein
MTTENTAEGEVRGEDVLTVGPTRFVPQTPVADLDTPLLKHKPLDKRDLLLAVNTLRTGAARVTVSVEYEIQEADPADLRVPGKDFVAVPGVSGRVHVGEMTTATMSKKQNFYIRVADVLRSTGLGTGWTSLRVRGIKSFTILQVAPGPLALAV